MYYLKITWCKWKAFGRKIGTFQSRLILTLFYFIILLPSGIVFSLFKDQLGIKSDQQTSWIDKFNQPETLEEMKKQH
jgi:hypothetical protein